MYIYINGTHIQGRFRYLHIVVGDRDKEPARTMELVLNSCHVVLNFYCCNDIDIDEFLLCAIENHVAFNYNLKVFTVEGV